MANYARIEKIAQVIPTQNEPYVLVYETNERGKQQWSLMLWQQMLFKVKKQYKDGFPLPTNWSSVVVPVIKKFKILQRIPKSCNENHQGKEEEDMFFLL